MFIRYVVQIIGALAVMLVLSWKLTLVMLSIVPAIAMGAVRYGRMIKGMRKEFQDALAASSTNAEEARMHRTAPHRTAPHCMRRSHRTATHTHP